MFEYFVPIWDIRQRIWQRVLTRTHSPPQHPSTCHVRFDTCIFHMTIQSQPWCRVAEALNAMGQKQQLIETMQLEIRCLTPLAGRGPVEQMVVEKCWVTCGKLTDLTGRLAWRMLRGHLDADLIVVFFALWP